VEGKVEPIEVLLVEDNAGDALLIRQILDESSTPINLHVANDGMQALFMLAGDLVHLDLIILDLNLPILSGHTVLERFHPANIPIVVFSSSWNTGEVQRGLALGAREFVRKPMDLESYRNAVRGIVEKWTAPKHEDHQRH
jgi:CheY-like chemotaxis protein